MLDIILAIIWIAILVLYIVVGWKDAKSNNEVKKEITQMNAAVGTELSAQRTE